MARAPRSGFAQMNRLKAGLKGGSGQAMGGQEFFPEDWSGKKQPDQFDVQSAEARNQDAEHVNGAFKGVTSGALTFPPKE